MLKINQPTLIFNIASFITKRKLFITYLFLKTCLVKYLSFSQIWTKYFVHDSHFLNEMKKIQVNQTGNLLFLSVYDSKEGIRTTSPYNIYELFMLQSFFLVRMSTFPVRIT